MTKKRTKADPLPDPSPGSGQAPSPSSTHLLRQSEEHFRALIEHSNDVIMIISPDVTLKYVSPSVQHLTGYASAELVGKSAMEYVHPDDLESARHAVTERMTGGGLAEGIMEIRLRHRDGSYRVYELRGNNLTEHPAIQGLVINAHDITARKRAEKKLRESAAAARARADELATVLDATPAITFIAHDPDCRRMTSSRAALRLLRLPDDANTSKSAPQDERPETFRAMKDGRELRPEELPVQLAAATGQAVKNFELTLAFDDGTARDIIGDAVPLFDAEGKVRGAVGAFLDITERKRAEQALKESEAKHRHLIEQAWDAIFVVDQGGKILLVNEQACLMLGYTQAELAQLNVADTYFAEERAVMAERIARVQRGEHLRYERSMVRKDGTTFPVEVAIGMLPNGSIQGIVRDITERKRAEEERERLFQEVRVARGQLQALSRRLVEAQETERRFIARELHDEVGQVLTGLKMLLETSSHLPADTLRSRLSKAQSLVEQLLEQVQGMSLDLRPTMLDDLGLLPALLWFAKRFANQTGVRVHLEHAGLDRRFAPEIETAVYRITQETLTNVARHAGVKEALARLWATKDALYVQIEDRGKGFHVQAALAVPTSSGLSGMHERAVALGGNLMIESTPGAGTHVTLEVPLSGSLERRIKER